MENYTKVAILGSGMAGLTAGVYLSLKGIPVVIFEKNTHLGGRTYSWTTPSDGTIDNGQHVLMGCYKETLSLLKKVGAYKRFIKRERLDLPFKRVDGSILYLKMNNLPFPFYLLSMLKNIDGLGISEIIRIVWMTKDVFLSSSKKKYLWSVDQWLDSYKVPFWVRKVLWEPLVLAATNEPIETASLSLSLKVFREVFFFSSEKSDLIVPTVSLSDLLINPTENLLVKQAAKIKTRQHVVQIEKHANKGYKILLHNNQEYIADLVISALPLQQMLKIIPDDWKKYDYIQKLNQIKFTSIITVYLWTSEAIIDCQVMGLLGSKLGQFIFNHNLIQKEGPSYCYSVVISSSDKVLKMTTDNIIKFVLDDLSSCFEKFSKNSVLKTKVIKFPKATHSAQQIFEDARKIHSVINENFILAGDWMQYGLPSTIESAVVSGKNAAQKVKEKLKASIN